MPPPRFSGLRSAACAAASVRRETAIGALRSKCQAAVPIPRRAEDKPVRDRDQCAVALSADASMLKASANRARVYAVFGDLNYCAAGPASFTLPSFLSLRLDDIAATTRRSC